MLFSMCQNNIFLFRHNEKIKFKVEMNEGDQNVLIYQ